jgi:hypothetical protein
MVLLLASSMASFVYWQVAVSSLEPFLSKMVAK